MVSSARGRDGMLSVEDNDRITKVAQGTSMGQPMRPCGTFLP
jgi:hypothetical protein